MLFLASMVRGEEPHVHGQTVPDWYDKDCCDNRDCRPVAKHDEPEAIMHGNEPAYRFHGLIFIRKQFRKSQDERFHVCIRPTGLPLCIYLPAMI